MEKITKGRSPAEILGLEKKVHAWVHSTCGRAAGHFSLKPTLLWNDLKSHVIRHTPYASGLIFLNTNNGVPFGEL